MVLAASTSLQSCASLLALKGHPLVSGCRNCMLSTSPGKSPGLEGAPAALG
jgi:hypothetical protein